MAGLLDLIYSVAVLLVTVGGLAFVLWFTGGDDGNGIDWSSVVVVVAIASFLAVMVSELVLVTT